ncbi:MAG: hypothetical protein A2X28_06115 [Elusimicrobia bacterium GWA2_56_46]|nr:MAG: hypothetical protein A2X28_06115 [Elusimicrobia bacterium GWA2_56_46]OGR54607.1 MAG: hypothetical protein A2X39_02165 [Elusimicrobia bacterium GWC2_56_31]
MWDFIKKLTKKTSQTAAPLAPHPAAPLQAQQSAPVIPPAPREPQPVPSAPQPAPPAPPLVEKPHAQKTDDELAEELNRISPGILSQAKNPQMRKLVIDIYRKMLIEGVDVNDEKEVKKWLKRNPAAAGGAAGPKVETVKRDAPKVGRNDPCVCGSGKKYKKCCGHAP